MAVGAAVLLLADARTPTGSHAHSGGLEAAVDAGMHEPEEVAAFLRGRLHTVAATEAAQAAAATTAAHAHDLEALLELDQEALARCPNPALRVAAATLGRSLLRTGACLWPESVILRDYRATSTSTPRPVALGTVAAAGGLTAVETATVALYDDLAGVAAAAVKLLPIAAAQALSWLAALAPRIDAVAIAAADPCAASALPSASAMLIELRATSHHAQPARLFAT